MAHVRPPSSTYHDDPLRFLSWAGSRLYTLWLRATYPFESIGRGTSVHHTATVGRAIAGHIKLGNSVTIGKDAWLNIIPESTDELNIIIDDDCCISARTVISAKNCIHLEQSVHLAPSVLIQDHSHFYEWTHLPIKSQKATEGGRIRIERGCRIGQGVAIVCDRGELVLGEGSIVMPNSVVLGALHRCPWSVEIRLELSGNSIRNRTSRLSRQLQLAMRLPRPYHRTIYLSLIQSFLSARKTDDGDHRQRYAR